MLLLGGSDIETTVDDIASLLLNVSLPYDLETLESFVQADDDTRPEFHEAIKKSNRF